MRSIFIVALLVFITFCDPVPGQDTAALPGTQPLTLSGDLSAQMVAGIDNFLETRLQNSLAERKKFWRRELASPDAYNASIRSNRARLRKYIGAVAPRPAAVELEYVSTAERPALIADTAKYQVHQVRWLAFGHVYGEGLLLRPKGQVRARVVALPDADQTPEMLAGLQPGTDPESQFARRLAENGCQVLVPVLIDRRDTWSGNAVRFTNQPHREWVYRQAYEMGRHVIGYEVQKIEAAVDWFAAQNAAPNRGGKVRLGVIGYAEGGLLALYAAALDPRIDSVCVSGYFDSRQRLWAEPIYRNVFALLTEFGDAEIASLILPRSLVIEYASSPRIDGPPAPRPGRSGAAPGQWQTPDFNSVAAEVQRAIELFPPQHAFATNLVFIHGNEGRTVKNGSRPALENFGNALGIGGTDWALAGKDPAAVDTSGIENRQKRALEQLVEHTQDLMRRSEDVRREFWKSAQPKTAETWDALSEPYRVALWNEVIGRIPSDNPPLNPRTRKLYEREKWIAYEVVLDVHTNVFAWGILLLPRNLAPNERRPVVVCQHGLEGVPADTITDDPKSSGYGPYKAFSARLAERGFVVFAPHNPYRGQDRFRVLQRKANPLKTSLFSVILNQHERILDWLEQQPFVDPARIGFYGLSYGGKTAMRVPSLLKRYALSICSADYNEWIKKNVTVDSPYSYMFTGEYEMFEFDLGPTFNYADMAALIAPRPFMVERGHHDGVAPDEWVAYEYAKVRRLYAALGIPERTQIEFFNGPHTINGRGTFDFLHRHLNWPAP